MIYSSIIFLPLEIIILSILFCVGRKRKSAAQVHPRRVWTFLAKLAAQRRLAVIFTGVLALLLSIGLSSIRWPVPSVHDEFSYLLAADTFAQGRLSNPTHPLWVHFDTFHINQHPTYASKYPPLQGFFLAIGQVLTGYPLVGVWLSTALSAAAVCWMLQGWLPPRWALLGGLLLAIHPALQIAWGQTYWGGAVTVLGGALLFGALPRIWQKPRPTYAIVLAIGAALLAFSRPYEGFLASLPVALAMLVWLWRMPRYRLPVSVLKVVLPVIVVLLAAGGVMAYYNVQVTGDPMTMPYQVNHRNYGATPLFLWTAPSDTPAYSHRVLRDFYTGFAARAYRQQRTLWGLVKTKGRVTVDLWLFFLTLKWTIPLLMLPWILRCRSMRFVVGTLLFAYAGSAANPWFYPHYFATVVPLMVLVVIQGIRHFHVWTYRRQRAGQLTVEGCIILGVLALICELVFFASVPSRGWQWERAHLANRLEQMPGDHLVLVRYHQNHNSHEEWVYNAANIDAASTIWARDLGWESNQSLLKYFQDRRVWLLQPDAQPPRLSKYTAAADEER